MFADWHRHVGDGIPATHSRLVVPHYSDCGGGIGSGQQPHLQARETGGHLVLQDVGAIWSSLQFLPASNFVTRLEREQYGVGKRRALLPGCFLPLSVIFLESSGDSHNSSRSAIQLMIGNHKR